MKKPTVTVIIPTFNEEAVIGRLLRSIIMQTYKSIETIVVDDGSTDKTVKIVKKHRVEVYERKHAERSVQRNFGVKKASGKYLLFLDADMKLSPNVVSQCVEEINKDKLIGAIDIPEKSVASNFWEKVKAFERSFYNLEGDTITDAARFFNRKVFNKVGGYDETITGPEDWDLPDSIKRKGYKRSRVKALIYHYERIPNIFSLVKKKYYYGLKTYRYLKKQEISPISNKTIYFLRPVFYKNWKKLVNKPVLSIAMFVMITLELVAGGVGYIIGKIKKL